MVGSAIVGTPPLTERDNAIIRGIYVQLQKPLPTSRPIWKGLAPVDPSKPGLPHDSNGPAMIPANAIGIALITIITSFRIFARWSSRSSRLGYDDLFIALAALVGNLWLAFKLCQITYGSLGKYSWDTTYEETYWQTLFGHPNINIFIVATCLGKISIACFNWRLTGRSSVRWKWVHIVCLVLVVCWGVSMFLANLLYCRPVVATNDFIVASRAKNYHCYISKKGKVDIGYAVIGPHIGFDIILLAIPIIIVWKLQIQKKQKLQAIVPLSVGALGCVAAILRGYYQVYYRNDQLLYNFQSQNDWGAIDIIITICVTSLPACWGLVSRKFRLYSSVLHSKQSTQKSNEGHLRQASPNNNVESKGLVSTDVTRVTENHSRSSISSRTLGDLEAQHDFPDKEAEHAAVAIDPQSDEQGDNEIFSGYGIAMGHPNLRDDYEKRASQRST